MTQNYSVWVSSTSNLHALMPGFKCQQRVACFWPNLMGLVKSSTIFPFLVTFSICTLGGCGRKDWDRLEINVITSGGKDRAEERDVERERAPLLSETPHCREA